MELVVLVDEDDRPIGTEEKLTAHRPPGVLHRAISVFLFDSANRVLLQRRATSKHHFAERWSNTCCTHPRPGEDLEVAARRRLDEEMGISAIVAGAGRFTYRAEDAVAGLVEHELDHVLVGRFAGDPSPNPAEVQAWDWWDIAALRRDLAATPERYTPWLAPALDIAASRTVLADM